MAKVVPIRSETMWADQSTVDAYVAHTEDVYLICRERGRHRYPATRRTEVMTFIEVTTEGFLVRKVRCVDCNAVSQAQEWEVHHKGGRIVRMTLVRTYPCDYNDDYLGDKGQGRMKPRQIRGAIATQAMKGMSWKGLQKDIVDLRVKELRNNG